MTIAIICLSVLLVCFIYSTITLLRKYERLEEYASTLEQWVNNINNQINNTIVQMEKVDSKGSFKTDDEVGTVYSRLYQIIKDLDNYILKEENTDGKKAKE